jgi:hypothetical protein
LVPDHIKATLTVLVDKCGHIPWLDLSDATWKALDDVLAQIH